MAFSFLKKKSTAPAKTASAFGSQGTLQRSSGPATTVKRPEVLAANSFKIKRAKSAFAAIRADFYEDLAEALEDRAVLVDELKKHMVRENKRGRALGALYALWLKRMDTLHFSNSLKGTVPTMDSLVMLAAETSGKLPQGLRFLANTVRSVGKIKNTLIGAVAVPIIIANMLVGMLYGFGKFMVPILLAILPVNHWPVMGQMMYTLSKAVTDYGLLFFALAIGGFFAFMWAMPNWVGPTRKKFDNHLPFSLYRDYNSAVMLVSLSGLMQSGSSLVGSLRAMRAASSPWLAWHLSQVLYNLDRESATPANAFHTGVMPQELYDRVSDYGTRSSFQDALTKIGNQALEKVEKAVQKKAKILNYVLLAVSGTLLALMIGSVMMTAQQARLELATQTTVAK